jgi:hypothetical protein
MPLSYAPQFRAMVVDQVCSGRRVAEVAGAVEVAEATVYRCIHRDRVDRGESAGSTSWRMLAARAETTPSALARSPLTVVDRRRARPSATRTVWSATMTSHTPGRLWRIDPVPLARRRPAADVGTVEVAGVTER